MHLSPAQSAGHAEEHMADPVTDHSSLTPAVSSCFAVHRVRSFCHAFPAASEMSKADDAQTTHDGHTAHGQHYLLCDHHKGR